MAKNIELIPGERSNWEIAFFLLIDEMVPFLKPQASFNRQDIVCEAGMGFLYNLLGSIGYEVNKTLENSLQGTINTMVKKELILSDYGFYTLTIKGYDRLKEIRKNYNPEKKEAIGTKGKVIMALESLPQETRENVMRELNKINEN